MEKRLKTIGTVSISLGVLAALLCVTPFAYGVFFAMVAGFLGLISSTIYIFIYTKNEISTFKMTPGIIGMVLSSIPVLLMLIIIILSKINR